MDSVDNKLRKDSMSMALLYVGNGHTCRELAPKFDFRKRFRVSLIFSKATCLKSFRILHGGNQWRSPPYEEKYSRCCDLSAGSSWILLNEFREA